MSPVNHRGIYLTKNNNSKQANKTSIPQHHQHKQSRHDRLAWTDEDVAELDLADLAFTGRHGRALRGTPAVPPANAFTAGRRALGPGHPGRVQGLQGGVDGPQEELVALADQHVFVPVCHSSDVTRVFCSTGWIGVSFFIYFLFFIFVVLGVVVGYHCVLRHNRYCFVILVLFVKLFEPERNGEILKSSWYYYYYYYYSSYRGTSVFKSTDPFMSLWLVMLLSFMKIDSICNRNVISVDASLHKDKR